MAVTDKNHLNIGLPACRFSGRFEDGKFCLKTKMKISFTLHWRLKMWRTQIYFMLKNENNHFQNLLKMKMAFLKIWRFLSKLWRKWRRLCVQGAPNIKHSNWMESTIRFRFCRTFYLWIEQCIYIFGRCLAKL